MIKTYYRSIFVHEPSVSYSPIAGETSAKPFLQITPGTIISGRDFGYKKLYLSDFCHIIHYMDHGDAFAIINTDKQPIDEGDGTYSFSDPVKVSDIIDYTDKRIIPIIEEGLSKFPSKKGSTKRSLARAGAENIYKMLFPEDQEYDTLKSLYYNFYK